MFRIFGLSLFYTREPHAHNLRGVVSLRIREKGRKKIRQVFQAGTHARPSSPHPHITQRPLGGLSPAFLLPYCPTAPYVLYYVRTFTRARSRLLYSTVSHLLQHHPCSHPPQNQHLLFYIQACSIFSVTSRGYVVRNRNIHYKFNALFKII
jgi:hypothetical protein